MLGRRRKQLVREPVIEPRLKCGYAQACEKEKTRSGKAETAAPSHSSLVCGGRMIPAAVDGRPNASGRYCTLSCIVRVWLVLPEDARTCSVVLPVTAW